MGFYLRKSLRAGPFRFNLSKSGIGVSVGVPGFRVSMGPRGNYVHMGGGGVYYRASLNPGRQSSPRSRPTLPVPEDIGIGEMREIESGDVLQMTDSSSEDLLREIRAKHQMVSLGKVVSWSTAGLAVLLLLGEAPSAVVWSILVVGGLASAAAFYHDQIRKSVVLFYDLDSDAEARFEGLHQGFQTLRLAQRIWHVSARGDVHDWKRNAGASSVVHRHPIVCSLTPPPFLKTNVAVPSIPVGRQTLYFFPDRLLVYDSGNVGAIGYADLRLDRGTTRFIEDESVPGDARIVDRTWKYVNKKGGPDRRFNDNRELPICLYEQVHLASGSGLNELLHVSRLEASQALEGAVRGLARSLRPAPAPVEIPANPAPAVVLPPAAPQTAPPPPPRAMPEPGSVRPAPIRDASARYFELLEKMQTAHAARDYARAIRFARESFPLLKAWVESEKKSYGRFQISSVPCLQIAGTLMAVTGDRDGLTQMRAVVKSVPDLRSWEEVIDGHEEDAAAVEAIVRAVEAEPGLRQRDLKARIGAADGRRPATLAEWLEKTGRIRRERDGGTYRLYPKHRQPV